MRTDPAHADMTTAKYVPKPHRSTEEILQWFAGTGNFNQWQIDHMRQVLNGWPDPLHVTLGRGKSSETSSFKNHYLGELVTSQDTPPTDPRAQALHVRDHRNTGPKPEPLHKRGRVTRYKTKG